MKRITLLLVGLLSLPFFSYSGGIVHNTNQSASWVRNFARDASTSIDAVFYNPAGLTKLGDGFFISLNSQTLFQNRTITSDYVNLNNTPVDYEGSVTVPVLPSIYAAYNTGKFSFSFGMNVIGGGGRAEFKKGLPSFETGISDLVPALASKGVTAYSLDAYLEGSSIFWGYQLGVSYEINDMISVYLGGRYVIANNTYNGHLQDVNIYFGATEMAASDFFTAAALQASSTATSLQPIITGGGGGLTLAQAEAFFIIDAATRAALETGFTQIGLDPATATISEAQAGFSQAAATSTAKSQILADQTADVEQSGTGITPIIGANITVNEKLNIGLKYEFATKIELENKTKEDLLTGFETNGTPITMFPDGEINRNDMPALLTIGVDYKASEKFLVSTGLHYYFDESANYGYKDKNDNAIKNSDVFNTNYWEWALGFEYNISDKMLISAGYLRAQSGLKDKYQTDINYKITSNSFGLGGAYSITPKIDLNLAVAYTSYVEDSKDYQHDLAGSGMLIDVTETYNRSNLFFGLGLDFKFGKTSE